MALPGDQAPPSLFLILVFFCLIFVPRARSSDDFNSMQDRIKLEGDASLGVDKMLELTKNYKDNVGHASFYQTVHLWDKSSNKLANFDAKFDFIIDGESGPHGDGLAFFLAPLDFAIPQAYAAGGYLALFNKEKALDPTKNQVVAIELDTFKDDWDSDSLHIGIDVNSIKSVATQPISVDCIGQQFKGNVRVQYDSGSHNLNADMTVLCNNGAKAQNVPTVSYTVDLRQSLPEFVKVGFSAATSTNAEYHRITSWTFNSNL